MTEAFIPLSDGIWRMAWEFVEKHGTLFGTVDDIFGELAVTFAKFYPRWNRDKAKLITHIYYRCYMRLKEIEAGRGPDGKAWKDGPNASFAVKRWQMLSEGESAWEPPDRVTNGFLSMWADLSDDARVIVSLVLDTPAGLARIIRDEGWSRFAFRSVIRSYLNGRGWSYDRITRTYLEIQENLK